MVARVSRELLRNSGFGREDLRASGGPRGIYQSRAVRKPRDIVHWHGAIDRAQRASPVDDDPVEPDEGHCLMIRRSGRMGGFKARGNQLVEALTLPVVAHDAGVAAGNQLEIN